METYRITLTQSNGFIIETKQTGYIISHNITKCNGEHLKVGKHATITLPLPKNF